MANLHTNDSAAQVVETISVPSVAIRCVRRIPNLCEKIGCQRSDEILHGRNTDTQIQNIMFDIPWGLGKECCTFCWPTGEASIDDH